MDFDPVSLKKLREHVLKDDGSLPLGSLLQFLVPVADLRDLAQKFGVSPKGGFRIERAPARVLAPLLADLRDKQQLDEVLTLLVAKSSAPKPPDVESDRTQADAFDEAKSLLALRDAEVVRLRDEIERAREGQARAREREVELGHRLSATQEELGRAKRQASDARSSSQAQVPSVGRGDKVLQHRVHELQSERDGLLAADKVMRRQLARDHSRTRELEDEVAELESLIPASRRRKKKPMLPEPEQEHRFMIPYFLPSFYKSIEGKQRRSVERAMQAISLFCTEGHGYPGLEVKSLGGQDTWSLRASLGLRVYFRPRPDGDIDVLELGDREDQNTTLRRLKEK